MMAMVGHDGYIPVPTASRLLLLVVDPRHCCGRDAVVAWSAGEFDSASAEGAGNVFEKDLHGRYVCGSTSLGVREDMAAYAAAGGFKDPCAGIARHYTTLAAVRPFSIDSQVRIYLQNFHQHRNWWKMIGGRGVSRVSLQARFYRAGSHLFDRSTGL